MAAIPNRIVIGNDPSNPIVEFDNAAIIAVDSDTSVSLVGEELYINQFEATVDYYVWEPYVFKPADGESVEYGPYSGDVVSFEADTVAPSTELTVAVEPVQDLHGYNSPWPAGGGKNKLPPDFSGGNIRTTNGVTYTNTDGVVNVNGTPTGDAYYILFPNTDGQRLSLPAGTYTISCPETTANCRVNFTVVGVVGSVLNANQHSYTFTLASDGEMYANILTNGSNPVNLTLHIQLENGSSATSFAPYENICPISGWDAVSIWNKPTHDTTASPTVTIQLGQTVYGGTLDVTAGTMTVDRAIITPLIRNVSSPNNYGLVNCDFGLFPYGVPNSDPRRADAICNVLKTQTSLFRNTREVGFLIANGTTAYLRLPASSITSVADANTWVENNACRVVYYLGTPITITLDPVTISTISDQTNNVWSDAGTIETVKFSTPGGDCDGFMSSDGYVLCTKQNYDIRLLPYGTKITYYSGGRIAGVFYVKNVERVQRAWYKIKATSAIGLLDKQYHRGGIYTGQYFQDVVTEILGNDYNYLIDGVVAVQRVYGWLPYDTKRKNLYQLLLAYGVEIVLGDNGAMQFQFPQAEQAIPIPTYRVFQGGKVIYDEPASLVEINEHSYHYDPAVEEVQLFDNSADESVTDAMVIFDQPIYPGSIYCSSGSLTISSTNTNFAVVSGSGILSGKPYVHNIRLLSKTNPSAPVEKVVRVEDATLVTFINADNVLSRLSEYYFNATRVEQDIRVENEKPGLLYTTENPFNELITGYIVRMNKSVTSFARATCRFLLNYQPTGAGQAYTERVVIPLGQGASETWTIPQAVFEKENPVFRIVLIGRGQNGAPGADGEDGTSSSTVTGRGRGGRGGAPGTGGIGGNILIVTLNATGLTQITVANSGNDSVLSSQYYHYSSADGAPNSFGYFDILTGDVYAYPGIDGTAGGAGGDGDVYSHTTGEASAAQPGEDVEYLGTLYTGGVAGSRAVIPGNTVGISGNLRIFVSACGGGAAAPGENGGDAVGYTGPTEWGDPGNGADAAPASPPSANYGNGGNGGNGGGGGGAGESVEYWNYAYTSVIGTESGPPGKGGNGSDGSAGNYGCAIIYY